MFNELKIHITKVTVTQIQALIFEITIKELINY